MTWVSPLPLKLVVTGESESFRDFDSMTTGIPVHPHPGSFGFVRRNHVHEGVDLYCQDGTLVTAVEPGIVVAILPFTGEDAMSINPRTGELEKLDWWHDTAVVMVEGASGVVAYGEITPDCRVGVVLQAGDVVGRVKKVLKKDKGRPMAMLHLELHKRGTIVPTCWYQENGQPSSLMDPTPYLVQLGEVMSEVQEPAFMDFGCPNTQMREFREEFEKYVADNKLEVDLHMRYDAPHYSSGATRKLYWQFVEARK
jgi:hypothetical protein